jgi:hypothetical protein
MVAPTDEDRLKAAAKFRARMVADIQQSEPEHVEGRFRDWTKEELILHLVQKGVVIRDENHLTYKVVRDLMKSYYSGLEDPSKPVNRYNELTKNIVDRGMLLFQDLYFSYLYKVNMYATTDAKERELKIANERDFGDAYGGETNARYAGDHKKMTRTSLGMLAAEAEAAALRKGGKGLTAGGKKALSAFSDILGRKHRGVRILHGLGKADIKEEKNDFHYVLNEIAQGHVHKRDTRSLEKSEAGERVLAYLDAAFEPPKWERALEHAESLRPRRWVRLPESKRDIYEPLDFYTTSTGRHCCSGSFGEQCDIFHEGKFSELSPLGPAVTNFFKFVKWLIWLFVILTAVSCIMTIINIYGPHNNLNSVDFRMSDMTMTTIGNLIYGLRGTSPTDFELTVPGCIEGAFTSVECQMDKNAVGWAYTAVDWAISLIFIFALVWLKKYERKEEVLLDSRLVTVSMYSVMVKNLPMGITEDELKTYIEEVCELKGLGDPKIENVTLGLDKFKSDAEDEDEGVLKKLDKLQENVSAKQKAGKTYTAAAGEEEEDDEADEDDVEQGSPSKRKEKGVYSSIMGGKKYSIKDVIARGKLVEERKRLVQKHRFDVTRLRTGNFQRGTGPKAVTKADVEAKVRDLREVFYRDVIDINKSITKHDGCLQLLEKSSTMAKVAFVTFETVQMAEKVLEVFGAGYAETVGGWFGCKTKNKNDDDIYPIWKGKRLRIVQAPDPDDVIWENLNIDWWPRMRGRFLTIFVGIVLCIISLALLVTGKNNLEKAYSEGIAGEIAGAETAAFFLACVIALNSYLFEQCVKWMAEHFEKHHSRETMEQSVFTRLLFFKLVNCTLIFLVCNNQWFQTMEPAYDPDITDDANELLALYIIKHSHEPSVVDFDYSWYANVGLMLMLVQIVTTLTSHIGMVQQWYRYKAQIEGVQRHCRTHESIWKDAMDLQASEEDTIPGDGGSVRTSDIEMGSVSTRGSSSFSLFGKKQKTLDGLYNSVVLSRSLEQEPGRMLLTQKEVNDKTSGPVFDWPVVYAQLISMIFVTLTFGTGMPMLYPFALINFIVSYFGYKFLFLNLYNSPPRNRSAKLSREATALIPLALTIHLVMSIWMLSYGDLFNNNAESVRDSDSKSYLSMDQYYIRFTRPHTLAGIAFGVLLLLISGAGFVYGSFQDAKDNIYTYLFTVPCTGVCGSGTITKTTVPGSVALEVNYLRAVQRNLIKGPTNYNILSNPAYKEKLGVGYDFAARNAHVHAKSYTGGEARGKALPARATPAPSTGESGDFSVKRSAPEHILHYDLGQRLKSMAARKFRPVAMGDDPKKNDISQEELIEVVTIVYELYNPARLPEVPELCEKFLSREHTMCASLVRKYHIGMDAFETQVYAIYETFNPSKTADVAVILNKYKGVEKKLFEGLRVKYRINMHPVENEMWTIIDEFDSKRRDEIVHMLNDAGGPHTPRAAELLQQIRDAYNGGKPMPLTTKANTEHFRYDYYNPYPRGRENIPLVPHTTSYASGKYPKSAPGPSSNKSSPPKPLSSPSATSGYTPVSLVGMEATEGKFILENGHLYVGQLRSRLPHGQGRINDPHSILELEGSFVAGKLRGNGRLLTVGGNLYEGEFDDLFHGHGVYKWKDGSVYEGSFNRGKKEGVGRYTGPSGNTYEGSFVSDEFDGFGIYTNAGNGVVYEGYFSRGRKEGPGQLFSKDGRSRAGVWKEGKEVRGAKPTDEQISDVKALSKEAHEGDDEDGTEEGGKSFVPTPKGTATTPPASKAKTYQRPTSASKSNSDKKDGRPDSFRASSAADGAAEAETWSESVTFEASSGEK